MSFPRTSTMTIFLGIFAAIIFIASDKLPETWHAVTWALLTSYWAWQARIGGQ